MVEVSRDVSDEELLETVFKWVNVLARGDNEAFGAALGYIMEDGPPEKYVRRAIADYRSPIIYPGLDSFSVTDWRTAKGGNPEPRQEVIWYKPNASMLAGAVTIDLPLNGKWSDLHVDFVLFDKDSTAGLELWLEEVYCPRQEVGETGG